MAKFYVQSGDIRFIVSAADAEGAALWVLNQIVNRFVPIDRIDDRLIDVEIVQHLVEGESFLHDDMLVSEIGFGRDDVAKFDVRGLFTHWCQLLRAMNHLLDQLDRQ